MIDIRGRKSDGRITVSINKETVEKLDTIKSKLADELSIKLSYTQVIDILIRSYNQQTN